MEQYEFPEAYEIEIDHVVYKCFEKNGTEWKTVAHIVVDYRAFFPWATWVDARTDQISILSTQRDIWRTLAKSAENAHQVTSIAYAEEHNLRLSIQRERRVTPWLLGGGLVIETILIVGLSIWGAAQ